MSGDTSTDALYNYLTTDADAADIRALVQGGADNIFMSGDLTEEILMDAIDARREAGAPAENLVLGIAIQEGPERVHGVPQSAYAGEQVVVIRVYDRDRGYWNIRRVVQALRKEVRHVDLQLTGTYGTHHLGTFYAGRTGHRWDTVLQVDYEAMTFTCPVQYAEDW